MKKINYIEEYLKYIKNDRNYSELTIINYSKDLNEFLSFSSVPLNKINKEIIKKYLKYIYDNNNKSSTVSRKISTLKSFYKYMKVNDIISTNPMTNIKFPKKEKKLPRFLYYNELEKIIEITKTGDYSQRNNLIIELLYSTGIRVSELVNIKLKDIDFNNKKIRIMGKGSYERFVFIGDYAYDSLNKYINNQRKELIKENTDYLILNKYGKKITPRGIFKIIDNIISQASIKTKVSPHILRHTFATHLLDNGCDLRSVQELLGHKSINSTEVYTHVTTDRLKEVYYNAHPRGKL